MIDVRPESRLQESLAGITAMLARHRVLDTLTHNQEGPTRDLLERLQHRQNRAELQKHLRTMHVADVAYVLKALSVDDRQTVWAEVAPERAGLAFVGASDAVRRSLIETTGHDDLDPDAREPRAGGSRLCVGLAAA